MEEVDLKKSIHFGVKKFLLVLSRKCLLGSIHTELLAIAIALAMTKMDRISIVSDVRYR